ncbi:hypothetical protein K0M31_003726 [Melipona bicolor]|uniref:Uncharacterized protein n=1 Tax=Melipona bicolor TaxID=60889 RepID=A0AA40FXI6_9HYME|nr:hypothetical protein K0M31_003726 [Melipona bicolor]
MASSRVLARGYSRCYVISLDELTERGNPRKEKNGCGSKHDRRDEVFECPNQKNAPPKHDWATVVALVVDAWTRGRVADEKCKLNVKNERHSMRWQQCSLTANLTSRMTGVYEGVN